MEITRRGFLATQAAFAASCCAFPGVPSAPAEEDPLGVRTDFPVTRECLSRLGLHYTVTPSPVQVLEAGRLKISPSILRVRRFKVMKRMSCWFSSFRYIGRWSTVNQSTLVQISFRTLDLPTGLGLHNRQKLVPDRPLKRVFEHFARLLPRCANLDSIFHGTATSSWTGFRGPLFSTV